MWDDRFAREGYFFGTDPAAFLRREAHRLPSGARVLCVAEGEGRNAVWLAGQGHRVTAFDASPVGVEKAHRLAAARGVEPELHVADVDGWDWSRQFDAVVAIFIQFAPPEMRGRIFAGLRQAVAPGGLLMLHGYTPRQVEYGTGGPPHAENMYTAAMLEGAFGGFDIISLTEYEDVIAEGQGHAGRSALIDLIARKPAEET